MEEGLRVGHRECRQLPRSIRPTRARRPSDASVDPTEARNKFIDPAVTVATAAGHSSRLSADVPEVFRQLVMSAVLGPVLGSFADLGIKDRGIGALSQELIDH